MGSEYQQLQKAIVEEGLQDRIRLLSISFDPTDSPDHLRRYSKTMKANPDVWHFVTMMPGEQRQRVLDDFGIVVIPAPFDEYEHNAAYHVVSSEPRLGRIVDYGEPMLALAYAKRALEDLDKKGAM
jgi:protein SCO1/2